MAGDIFLGALVLWGVLAFATARAASQTGYSFVEFFVYALVALPVAFMVVALAAEAAPSGTGVETPSGTGVETLPRTIGLCALRTGVAATVAAVVTFIAMSPERTLRAIEHTVVAMEQVAHQGVQFDKCVSEAAFADCQPLDDIAISAAADLDMALAQGGGLTLGDVRPAISEFFDGMSTSGQAAAARSVVPKRVATGLRDAIGSRSSAPESFGQTRAVTERRPTVEKAVPVAYRAGARDTRYNVQIVLTGGAPLRLVRD